VILNDGNEYILHSLSFYFITKKKKNTAHSEGFLFYPVARQKQTKKKKNQPEFRHAFF
jgi:hypothetical protein